MKQGNGMVYLVGAGPGDPGLITKKGAALLARAEALVYDRLASQEFLKDVPKDCEKIYVGKQAGRHSMKQEEINAVLVRKAREGKLVVRLKGGDPFVFGRGGEEILELEKNGVPYEVVSGVTSAVAALAHAGIPVTHRSVSQSFHVITGHTAESGDTLTGGFCEYAKLSGTLVFLMGLSNLEKIVSELTRFGKSPDTPAAVVTDGTLPQERCVRATLGTLSDAVRRAGLTPPGIIAVGETAGFSMTCEKKRILTGISVGITGTDAIFEKLSAKLSSMGARVVRAASSAVVPENRDRLLAAVDGLTDFSWIVFTSRNAVSLFFDAMREREADFRSLAGVRFAVVGRGTGDFLKTYGFTADYMPDRYTAKALAEGLADRVKRGERVFIPRARQGSAVLTETLARAEISCLDLPVYDIRTEEEAKEALSGLDYITFESGSAVRGFFASDPEKKAPLFQTARAVCIGHVTAGVLAEFGVTDALVAETYTAGGIADLLASERMKRDGDVCL